MHVVKKIAICLIAVLLTAPIAYAKRVALVMGNDQYLSVSKLQKAGNDADAMARELKAAGFVVQLQKNLNYRSMVRTIESFANNIASGDDVVVFFAGHGVQIKSGNYILPIDIEAESESEIEKMAYGLNELTEKLSDAKAGFALVVIDACRDNPMRTKGRSIGANRGLSPVEPAKGQMVIYSASKGQQALDRLHERDTNPNGVFTREFIARMRKPGMRIEELVRDVQDAVESLAKTVRHDQRPALYNEARGNFYFYGPTAVQIVPPVYAARVLSEEQKEEKFWDDTKAAGNKEAYEAYLESYPKGRYVSLAKANIARFNPLAINTTTKPDALLPTNPETLRLYRLANEQNDTDAQVRLGLMYMNGTGGVVKDEVEVVRLIKLAAAKNHPQAQVILGFMYENGRGGLVKDEAEAVYFYRLSAAQNNALGQTNLGLMYESGRGGLIANPAEAMRLYKLAADQNNTSARNHVSRLQAQAVATQVQSSTAQSATSPHIGLTNYPIKPVKIIVPYPPGGTTDVVGRVIAQNISSVLGQPFIIENKAGAAAVIGTEAVARSAADGHTLLITNTSYATVASVNLNMRRVIVPNMSSVSMLTKAPLILAINTALPVKDVRELIAYAKANPGKLTHASGGNATLPHFVGESFRLIAGISISHVPLRGTAPAIATLLNGEQAMIFASVASLAPLIASGKLRGLAVTSLERTPLSNLPTLQSTGISSFDFNDWNSLMAPKGTPQDVIAKLNQALRRILDTAEVRERIEKNGFSVWPSTTTAAAIAFVDSEVEKFSRIAKAGNIVSD